MARIVPSTAACPLTSNLLKTVLKSMVLGSAWKAKALVSSYVSWHVHLILSPSNRSICRARGQARFISLWMLDFHKAFLYFFLLNRSYQNVTILWSVKWVIKRSRQEFELTLLWIQGRGIHRRYWLTNCRIRSAVRRWNYRCVDRWFRVFGCFFFSQICHGQQISSCI